MTVQGLQNSGFTAAPAAPLPLPELEATQVATRRPVASGQNVTAAFKAVEDVFNLSANARNAELDAPNFDEPEVAEYLSLTAKLLQAGVVGFEDLDVGDRPTRTFASLEFSGGYTDGARPYRGPAPTGAQLNLSV